MLHYETQILIVGSGPAGLSTAWTLRQAGYETLILERGVFAAGVSHYPTYMRFFSTVDKVELCGYPLTVPDEKPTRQQYLRYLQRFATSGGLPVLPRHEVTGLEGADGAFVVGGKTALGEPFEARAEKIVLATGAYDHPNLLHVPGECLPKVSHYYTEVNDYIGQKVLIVGGRHSAAEAALELARAGVDVALCYRGASFKHLKYWVAPDLENRVREGAIKAYMNTVVLDIRPRSVVLQHDGRRTQEVENDAVLALIGYHPNPAFLSRMGVATDAETRCPIFDPETLESTRPGVYLAGVMLAGNISGAIFIENSRHHGRQVLAGIEGRKAEDGRRASEVRSRNSG